MIWPLLDALSATVFGIALFYGFLYEKADRRSICVYIPAAVLILLLQAGIILRFGPDTALRLYPLLLHLPFILLAVCFSKRSPLSALTALMLAFLMTEMRSWPAELTALFFSSVPDFREIVRTLITLPLLALLLHFLTPTLSRVLNRHPVRLQLILVPAMLYYIFSYVFVIYTNLLYEAPTMVFSMIIVSFTFCYISYVLFLFRIVSRTGELEQRQQLLRLQSEETERRLEEIHYTQEKTRIMRHDMRHYSQMINGLLNEQKYEEIRDYLQQLTTELDETILQEYCGNEAINLILSSYSGKARKKNIRFTVSANVPSWQTAASTDVCLVLANGIENAIHAVAEVDQPWISVECNLFHDKIVICIRNPYTVEPKFENGRPRSAETGHGIGTLSIEAVAERHGGAADFHTENGVFVLSVVL